jgi:hypothetical protein
MSNKKQTAVEWLIDTMTNSVGMEQPDIDRVFEQAKELEKQQIIDAYCEGRWSVINKNIISYEQYYTQTYGGQNNEQ